MDEALQHSHTQLDILNHLLRSLILWHCQAHHDVLDDLGSDTLIAAEGLHRNVGFRKCLHELKQPTQFLCVLKLKDTADLEVLNKIFGGGDIVFGAEGEDLDEHLADVPESALLGLLHLLQDESDSPLTLLTVLYLHISLTALASTRDARILPNANHFLIGFIDNLGAHLQQHFSGL